jgi:hypothetical protein
MADGGATDFGKVVSASSRFRPMETIVFDPPLVGLNGAKLISYTWSFQWDTSFSKLEGEAISKRVSDWTQADISAETGRDIVHKYTIQMPNGDLKVVSSDSVPVLLGYTDRAQKSSFPNLSNAAKTLAKQKLQLSIMEAKAKEKAKAEEMARKEAEEKARKDAEKKAKADSEAQEKARLEAEEKTRLELEEKAKLELESKAKAEAEEKAKKDALLKLAATPEQAIWKLLGND